MMAPGLKPFSSDNPFTTTRMSSPAHLAYAGTFYVTDPDPDPVVVLHTVQPDLVPNIVREVQRYIVSFEESMD